MTDTTICLLILIVAIIFFVSSNLRIKWGHRENEETKKDHDGDIFVNDYGEIYAQFDIPIDQIIKSDKLVMKVHHVKNKEK